MAKTKYFVNTFTIKVLSEDEPMPDLKLEDLNYTIEEGHYLVREFTLKNKEISAKQMVKETYAAGSDPDFFQLDDEGKSTEELDTE
jgi:hypothetical protein